MFKDCPPPPHPHNQSPVVEKVLVEEGEEDLRRRFGALFPANDLRLARAQIEDLQASLALALRCLSEGKTLQDFERLEEERVEALRRLRSDSNT